MCLAVPAKVTAVDGTTATVDFGGLSRDVLLDLLPGVAVGDYVLVHAGFAIQRLEAGEAEEILDIFAQLAGATGGTGEPR
jgi:hydrogenase expression/formation protein HypC